MFAKSFPKGTTWQEVVLTQDEESYQEKLARQGNVELMKQCLEDAKELENQDTVRLAVALFEKLASHQVFWKERACKRKFEKGKN